MSRLPREAASRNISAWSAHAMSQVGWRLMVASSAKISRPRLPSAWGDIARAFATKAAMSSDVEALLSGRERVLAASFEVATSPVRGFEGSSDIGARLLLQAGYAGNSRRLVRQGFLFLGVLRGRNIKRDRSRVDNIVLGFHLDRRDLGVVGLVEELVQHALDRGLGFLRSGVAHVIVLEGSVDDGDAGLLTLIRARNDARIRLELRILGAERENLELARGDE